MGLRVTFVTLTCGECGRESMGDAERAYIAGGLDGEEDPDPAAHYFCPDCAKREFDG